MTASQSDGRATTPAIVVDGLTKHFDEVQAVRGVDFEVASGEVFGFLGPNGAGKTTTINMLCTLAKPTSGVATVAGHDVVSERDDVRRLLAERDDALLAALPADANVLLLEVDVAEVEADRFRASQPGRVDELDESAKEWDREAVRAIPTLLEAEGWGTE